MSELLDTVAEAIWQASPGDAPWHMAGPVTKGHYRRMAQAAIDATGINETLMHYSECQEWVLALEKYIEDAGLEKPTWASVREQQAEK